MILPLYKKCFCVLNLKFLSETLLLPFFGASAALLQSGLADTGSEKDRKFLGNWERNAFEGLGNIFKVQGEQGCIVYSSSKNFISASAGIY